MQYTKEEFLETKEQIDIISTKIEEILKNKQKNYQGNIISRILEITLHFTFLLQTFPNIINQSVIQGIRWCIATSDFKEESISTNFDYEVFCLLSSLRCTLNQCERSFNEIQK